MKKIFVLLVLVFCFGLVAAHSDYYDVDEGYVYKEKIVESEFFPDDHLTVSRTTYVDYDNDRRYPTEDYKYGYTYRKTKDYLNSRYRKKTKKIDYERYEKKGRGKYYDKYDRYDYGNKDYYFRYIPYLKTYEKVECYHEAPRGQLFYFKC
ncbi:hypothetical protein HN935_00200 [archaeon]|jgi:hypothetical protein|nr:hypothetical protein [archaeon]